jgi:hypothetical protein
MRCARRTPAAWSAAWLDIVRNSSGSSSKRASGASEAKVACNNYSVLYPTRIGMRASSDARLAAARGLGRYSRWTRYQHVFGSYCRTSATRGVGSDSDFQVWGGSDDILLTSPTRGAVRSRLRSFAVPCPESPLQRSRRRSMPRVEIRAKGRDSLHKLDVPDRVLCHPSSPTLGNPSLNQLPVWQMFDNMT